MLFLQVVGLHPSCGLKTQPEWVIFNEFVLTARPYIRTVTEVRPDWCAPFRYVLFIFRPCAPRLLEYAPFYFDLKTFPDGETKRALQRVQVKKNGSRKGTPSVDTREVKRRKQE